MKIPATALPFIPVLLDTLAPDSAVTNWAEKLSLIGALGFFLYYFMKELKETRDNYEAKLTKKDAELAEERKAKETMMLNYEAKIEKQLEFKSKP